MAFAGSDHDPADTSSGVSRDDLNQAPRGKRHPCVRTVADDHVVMDSQVHQLRRFDELPREPRILPLRRRIAGWVVVNQNQRRGAFSKGWSEHFSRVHKG